MAVAGLALLANGAARLPLVVSPDDLFLLLLWTAGAVVLHDGLLTPLVLGVGAALRRKVPDTGRPTRHRSLPQDRSRVL